MKKKFKIITVLSVCIGVLLVAVKFFSKKAKELEEDLDDLDFSLDENNGYGF